ncbi:MAG: ankyrin repeat domain-containing protein [Maritimibacter sp.]
MSLLKTIFASVFSSAPASTKATVSDPLSPQDILAFHDLIATGAAQEVATALRTTPALATAADQYGFQAIHLLDYEEFHEKLALLLKAGADINAANDEGHTLLHVLIEPSFLSTLIHGGAKVDARDKFGRTPLMVHLTEPDGLAFLTGFLDAGANPNAKDNDGRSVLGYAKAHRDRTGETILRQAGARD